VVVVVLVEVVVTGRSVTETGVNSVMLEIGISTAVEIELGVVEEAPVNSSTVGMLIGSDSDSSVEVIVVESSSLDG